MQTYRLYFWGADGHIRRAMDLQCADDATALEAARAYRAEFLLELWQGARKVGGFEPLQPMRA